MHLSVDPKVARALYYAWRAREQLELPPATVRRMVARVRSVANSPFFRYPNIRLNQINFSAEIQACAVSMTDDPRLLRVDYRRQLSRFLRGVKRAVAPWRIANLGPSYNFHRNPFQRAGVGQNIESTEYANIVLDVLYYYEQARARGHDSRSPWRTGARCGRSCGGRCPAYWTHSGYLNWDTGLYLYRWHLSRYWAWSCQGLLAIASSKNFVSQDDERRWAKYMFDRSLTLYERFSERWDDDRREPGSSLYGITTKFSEGRHFELARFQALAAEAILRGMGDDPAVEPPPLYAFDPSIGRLAITTPTYNTAIVAVSNGAFPYGGIDIARWYDSRQRVISHIGGRAPARSASSCAAPNGTLITASQRPRTSAQGASPDPEQVAAGADHVPSATRAHPTPGRSTEIETAGWSTGRACVSGRATCSRPTTSTFAWQMTRTRTDALTAEARCRAGVTASLNAVLRSGQVVKLAGTAFVRLSDVRYFFIDGTEGGYVVVPRSFPPTATAHVIKPSAQSSNPRSGPERLRAVRHGHAVARRLAADRDGAGAERRGGGGPGAAAGRRLTSCSSQLACSELCGPHFGGVGGGGWDRGWKPGR